MLVTKKTSPNIQPHRSIHKSAWFNFERNKFTVIKTPIFQGQINVHFIPYDILFIIYWTIYKGTPVIACLQLMKQIYGFTCMLSDCTEEMTSLVTVLSIREHSCLFCIYFNSEHDKQKMEYIPQSTFLLEDPTHQNDTFYWWLVWKSFYKTTRQNIQLKEKKP